MIYTSFSFSWHAFALYKKGFEMWRAKTNLPYKLKNGYAKVTPVFGIKYTCYSQNLIANTFSWGDCIHISTVFNPSVQIPAAKATTYKPTFGIIAKSSWTTKREKDEKDKGEFIYSRNDSFIWWALLWVCTFVLNVSNFSDFTCELANYECHLSISLFIYFIFSDLLS